MTKTVRTVAVCAMDSEAGCAVSALSGVSRVQGAPWNIHTGVFHGEDVAVLTSGIGKVAAAAAAQYAVSALGAETILNFGLCGGFGCVRLFGVYEVSEAAEYDFDLSAFNGGRPAVKDGCESPFARLDATGAFPAAKLATGDRFNDSGADDEFISATLGCGLRDMEGAAIAAVCALNGVRCISVKCVSDIAGSGPMTGQYLDNKARALSVLASAVGEVFSRIFNIPAG